jgi:putative ABC transport system permease protein
MLKETVSMAVYNISHRKMRSALTVLGIVIGIATIVAIMSLSSGIQASIYGQLTKITGNSVTIVPGNINGMGSSSSGGLITQSEIDQLADVEGVEAIAGIISQPVVIGFNDQNTSMSISIVDNPKTWAAVQGDNIGLESGRYVSSEDKYSAVIGNALAYDIFDKDITIRKTITINDVEFKVVGIMNKAGGALASFDKSIYITRRTMDELFPNVDKDKFSAITVKIARNYDVNEVADRLEEKMLKLRHETAEKKTFTVISPKFFQETISRVMGSLSAFLLALGLISLLVGGIGIMNIMYVSVSERTREVGVMKALGAKKRTILMVFLVEAGIVGIIGGIIGSAAGLGLAELMNYGISKAGATGGSMNFAMQLNITPDMIIIGILFGFIVGVLAGYFPSRKAANMQPVEALRYE